MSRHSALPWRSWEWLGSWASELMLGALFPLHGLSTFPTCLLLQSPLGPASPFFVGCGCLGERPGVIFLRICISGSYSSEGRGRH